MLAPLLLSVTLALCASSQTAPLVTTSSGSYRGVVDSAANIDVFKGIRYAQAPVGRLRFAAPVAARSSQGVQDASKFGNVCPQAVSFFLVREGGVILCANLEQID